MAQEGKNKQQQQNNKQQSNANNSVKKQQQQAPAGKQNDVSSNGKKSAGNAKSQPVAKSAASQPLTAVDKVFATILLLSALVLVIGASHLANTGRLSVLQPQDRKAVLESLNTFTGKLEFTAKYWILGLIWLYFHIHVLIGQRITTKAANPLAGSEDRVQAEKNVFSNSIEQFLMAIITQTSALPYLTATQVLHIIPLFNGLFLAGRVFFWLGYPKRRSFGFTLGMVPISMATFFTTYHFVTHNLDLNPDSLFKLSL